MTAIKKPVKKVDPDKKKNAKRRITPPKPQAAVNLPEFNGTPMFLGSTCRRIVIPIILLLISFNSFAQDREAIPSTDDARILYIDSTYLHDKEMLFAKFLVKDRNGKPMIMFAVTLKALQGRGLGDLMNQMSKHPNSTLILYHEDTENEIFTFTYDGTWDTSISYINGEPYASFFKSWDKNLILLEMLLEAMLTVYE